MSSTPAFAINQTTCEKAFLSLMWEEIHQAMDDITILTEFKLGK
jgi:hypothetical protein